MQFSIKTVLAIAIGMSTLASAAPSEAKPEAALAYRCCAFEDCTVCADVGHPIYSCDNCDQVCSTIHITNATASNWF